MEIKKNEPKRTRQGDKEELEKVGGYDAWRRKSYTNEVVPEPPKPRALSKSEQYADACKLAAAYHGISIKQFFQREPERYQQYCRLVLEE